jgi:hypothetical protein
MPKYFILLKKPYLRYSFNFDYTRSTDKAKLQWPCYLYKFTEQINGRAMKKKKDFSFPWHIKLLKSFGV